MLLNLMYSIPVNDANIREPYVMWRNYKMLDTTIVVGVPREEIVVPLLQNTIYAHMKN